jgi:hypothetical protein
VVGGLVVGRVEEEPVGLLDPGLDEAVADVTDSQPAVVRSVEIDLGARVGLEDVDGVVELRVAVRDGRRRVDVGGLAPLLGPVDVGVPRDDAEAVGLEDDDRLAAPDPGRDPVDERLVVGGVLRPAEYCAQSRCGTS